MVKQAPTNLDSRFRGNDGCGTFRGKIAGASFRPSGARAGIQGSHGDYSIERGASLNPKVHWGFLGLVFLVLALGMLSDAAFAQSQLPEAVRNVGIDQRLNEQLP